MSQSAKIAVITAYQECCMCPTTIIGQTVDGLTVYARYRWGMLSVRVDSRDPAPHGGAGGVWILERQIDPQGLAGAMGFDELKKLTAEIVEWPEHLSPRNLDEGEADWLLEL